MARSQVIAFTRYSKDLTSDIEFEVKVTEIETCLRSYADAHMVCTYAGCATQDTELLNWAICEPMYTK